MSVARSVNWVTRLLHSSGYKQFDFYLLGGEPTLSPALHEILSVLSNEDTVQQICVLTTRIPPDNLLRQGVKYIITIHPSSKEKINVEDLATFSKEATCQINLILDSAHVDKTVSYYEKLQSVGSIEVKTLHIKKPPDYVELLPFPVQLGKETQGDLPSFTGKYCLQGTTCLRVTPSLHCLGSVGTCSSRFHPPQIVKCSKTVCDCDANWHIVKTDSLTEAKELLLSFQLHLKG